jgi:hypothetical protein
MKFSFDVGSEEVHRVDFAFNQIVGNSLIEVDGIDRDRGFQWWTLDRIHRYELTVGEEEEHLVRIEKEHRLPLPAFRKQKYRVYVDDQLAHEYDGF